MSESISKEQIIEQINLILTDEFEMEPDDLSPDAKLFEDLELDSLDAVDLIVRLEKKFGTRIPEDDARQLATLGDVYDFIGKLADQDHA